jgi:2-keto-4-pentenoate hydratase/2-oxohepta-3-ene-1,7-dioic acid hydratase in catechol pathway
VRLISHKGRAAFADGERVHWVDEASEGRLTGDPSALLAAGRWDELVALHARGDLGAGAPWPAGALQAPTPRPGTIFGIGANYAEHAKTAGIKAGSFPTVFIKLPASVVGPTDDVAIPAGREQIDWEAELAFVIGRPGRRIAREDALDHVAGIMVCQDITERDVQFHAGGGQFTLGKGYDTFCPLGPALVTLDELPPLGELRIKATINDEVVQDGSVGDMTLDVPALIEVLSRVTTLRPGDVVLTGTPAGTGFTREPARFLAAGDRLVTEIPGVGTLSNAIVDEAVR